MSLAKFRLDSFIDRGSIEGFSRQILTAVADSAGVALLAPDGTPLWCSAGAGDRLWCRDAGCQDAPAARREELGSGRYVYSLPLRASNDERLTLAILVRRHEPQSAGELFRQLESILGCLERQFEVSATLTSGIRISDRFREQLDLTAAINALEPADSLVESLERLADACRERLGARRVAILLPDRKMQILRPVSVGGERSLMAMLGRLITRAKSTGRILISRERAGGAEDAAQLVLSAPVTDTSGHVIGIFAAIDGRFSKEQAKLARTIANKVDLFCQQFSRGRPTFLSRDQLIEVIDQSLKRLPSSSHSVLYLDVDKTHLINDSFGYDAGDRAIKTIANLLKENAGKEQLVSHLMGDRFALLLRQTTSDAARSRADHILELLNREVLEREGKTLQLSASIGVATAPEAAHSGAELLTIAEVASRGAKERGGNQCTVFEPVDASIIQRRSDADQVGYLQMALIEDRFVLHAQEIRSLDPEATSKKFEVLVRLQDDAGGLIPPQKFLSAAERYQMMAALDRWVITRSLDLLARSTNSLEVSLAAFSINVSPQSLREVDFIEHVEQAIADSGVSPDMLCFELTETAMVRNFDQAQRFVHRLQKRGCRVALDDFGTGYSSFAYLKHLPVQYLKVDGSFVRDLLESRLSESIVAAVVSIARVIGAATVAEHVENELIQRRLVDLGVDFAQGFHVHRPEPMPELLDRLDRPDPALSESLLEPLMADGLEVVDF